ncbi:efflux RND transporter periplasmic adaptor subunit [Psychrobacter cryohalolentis]|uniref:Secretion protein HlyD n=1 Tax=Psychrobacter cryohalolentis (strain ATCC BAA-1226 / DSM 17306 / VKM B-2378 / K5) TaxID=335284 RepID=Q1Q8X4_PSYCK|nr:HlyD family efflux transporter periplasmic adaptor subunit [Psychrobacter cryohalolentis]ABE75879.1 Secretion protein HlyD [Psychrobacter cryohalolentis K5]
MTFFMRSLHYMRFICLQTAPLKKSVYILSALFLIACQPTSPTEVLSSDNNEPVDIPLISADSVTITPDHILSIKPTRYQPSLGLQGRIEPIKQINLMAAQPLTVEQVLVSDNQWVKKGTPLLTVRRQEILNKAIGFDDTETNIEAELNTTASNADGASTSDNTSQPSVLNKKTNVINDNNRAELASNSKDRTTAKQSSDLITLRARFSGRVENLSVQAGQKIEAQTVLLKLSDETELHFISTLPIEAESQISVGQTVNFTAEDRVDKFTGQVSKVQAVKQPIQLLVYVNVINNEVSRNQLAPDMQVTGRVDYGQIEVGTIVPKIALHNVDLTQIQVPPYKPLRSLTANIWIIGQDQRLTRQPIEVIEYDPLTKQYLIAGISSDSLICLANLPIESKGKKVVVS